MIAKVSVRRLKLPSGEVVGTISVLFDAPWLDEGCCVSMPTAARFKGFRQDIRQPVELEIIRLNKAETDVAGTVVLADGTVMCDVEVVPARLPLHPSELDWNIVHAALKVIPGGQQCYKSFREHVPPALQDMVPDEPILDCSKLSQLKDIPPLKVIAIDITQMDPELRKISQQKIADALRAFGIRVPRARPRISA
jgi:hypothetical protein